MKNSIYIVLDDEPLATIAISVTLKKLGVDEVHTFQKVDQAINLVTKLAENSGKLSPCVVFIADFSLNDARYSGADVLRLLPNNVNKCMVSADPTNKAMAIKNGWPFLHKPIRRESVACLIQELVSMNLATSTKAANKISF
jgi:hypothetical protein